MKILLQICLCAFSMSAFCQPHLKNAFNVVCDTSLGKGRTEVCDTSLIYDSNVMVISCLDTSNETSFFVRITDNTREDGFNFENFDKAHRHSEYSDKAGRIIYKLVTENRMTLECYYFKYNEKGQLAYKEGYTSKDGSVKIYYEYDFAGKLRKETTIKTGGTTVKEY